MRSEKAINERLENIEMELMTLKQERTKLIDRRIKLKDKKKFKFPDVSVPYSEIAAIRKR